MILGKRKNIDFSEPLFELNRIDTEEIRQKILAITYSKVKQCGFSKGTLWYMKQNAKSIKPFKIYESAKEKLMQIG